MKLAEKTKPGRPEPGKNKNPTLGKNRRLGGGLDEQKEIERVNHG